MKKRLLLSAVGLIGAAAFFAGCSSSGNTVESISRKFLDTDAKPVYDQISVSHESHFYTKDEYNKKNANIGSAYDSDKDVIISVLREDSFNGLNEDVELMKDNTDFREVWDGYVDTFTQIQSGLNSQLRQKLSEGGLDPNSVDYLIGVSEATVDNSYKFLLVSQNGELSFDVFELYESLNK